MNSRVRDTDPQSSPHSVVLDLTPPHVSDHDARYVNLRDVGFVGNVSQPALDEIERNEARANRVVTTAATFAFR